MYCIFNGITIDPNYLITHLLPKMCYLIMVEKLAKKIKKGEF